jgi:hypothetical protein
MLKFGFISKILVDKKLKPEIDRILYYTDN